MTVYFIGAGPGAADLLTLRAKALIERCPVILYAGSLIPDEMLAFAGKDARIINTAPLSLDGIIEELSAAHSAGHDAARLHSGDTSLYSAMAEQMNRLNQLKIPYEVVPGVPAFAAAAAALGQELTLPAINQTVILTRTSRRATAMPGSEQLKILGASKATLVIHLSAKNAEKIEAELIPHYGADCPVIIAVEVSWPGERFVRCTLGGLSATLAAEGIERTAMIFVGRAMDHQLSAESALYDSAHARHLKPARPEK